MWTPSSGTCCVSTKRAAGGAGLGQRCDFANVINDNARIGARLAVRHLLEQGHTNIVCITGHLAKPTTQQRLDGVRCPG